MYIASKNSVLQRSFFFVALFRVPWSLPTPHMKRDKVPPTTKKRVRDGMFLNSPSAPAVKCSAFRLRLQYSIGFSQKATGDNLPRHRGERYVSCRSRRKEQRSVHGCFETSRKGTQKRDLERDHDPRQYYSTLKQAGNTMDRTEASA